MRHYSNKDQKILKFDTLLNGIWSLIAPRTQQAIPGAHEVEADLDTQQQQDVISMMRVNHTGEVCAQALYTGQALATNDLDLQNTLRQAGREEENHLHWTLERVQTLGGRTSLLNPLWYLGSLSLGVVAGLSGNKWSLGFVQETEKQVEAHLTGHLERLPEHDLKSRAVVTQMRDDEMRHANVAFEAGAAELPGSIRFGMKAAAKVMTTVAAKI